MVEDKRQRTNEPYGTTTDSDNVDFYMGALCFAVLVLIIVSLFLICILYYSKGDLEECREALRGCAALLCGQPTSCPAQP